MKAFRYALALVLLLISVPRLHSQSGGSREGDLYIPPKLSIGLKHDMSWVSRLYNMEMEVEESDFTQELRIERGHSIYNTLRPLPIIFFDPASSVIPQRYQLFGRSLDADEYREDQEIDVTYESGNRSNPKYREILNIIGSRMSRNDTMTLELLGGYSTEPGETPEVGRERSQVVAEYLQNVWRIDPSRITLLPPQLLADSSDHILAQEEARSVRIYPSDYRLLDEVHYTTTELSMQLITLSVGLAPNMSRSEIARIRLVIASGDDILGETVMPVPEGEEYGPIGWTCLWFLPRKISAIEEPLSFNAVVETLSGSVRASNTVSIPMVIVDPEQVWESEEVHIAPAPTLPDDSEVRFDDWEEGEGYDDEEYDEEEEWTAPTDVTYFEGELEFFDFRDTTPGRLQQRKFEGVLDSIRAAMAADTTYRWRIDVSSDADASESPDMEDAVLRTGQSIYTMSQEFGNGFFTDPDFQVSLYIFPDVVPSGEVDQQLMIADLISQMYGDRAPEMQRMQERAGELYSDQYSGGRELPAFDSLRVARSRGFLRYLSPHIDTALVDSTIVQRKRSYTSGINWLPEERFYARTVTWEIYRSDSWRWDEDVYDEYDYEYDDSTRSDEYIEEENESPEMEYEESEGEE